MPENSNNDILAKADVFFARAQKVVASDNFDYAIDMYLEGLRCNPEAVAKGHIALHNLAVLRKVQGGKGPSMMEKVKHLRAKTPLDQMLNAEYLFAKDPDHLPYAEAMLKAAAAGDYRKTARWIADFVFKANNAATKPSFQTYVLLKDSYFAINEFEHALGACQRACKLKPEDADLANEFQTLAAETTVAKGKYDQAGDFRKSLKDRQGQEKLHAQAGIVKTEDYRITAVIDARKAFDQDPELGKNIFHMTEALDDLETDDGQNEAIEILENTYKTKGDFSFKQRAGEIRLKQCRRKIRNTKSKLEANPNDAQAKAEFEKLKAQLNDIELDHYRKCVENYPTDLQAKYEYGSCLLHNKRYDDAIPLLQEAQIDPRHKITAMGKIGMCFYKKGWFADAIDVFAHAIESYEIDNNSTAKELRYNLARSWEKQGDMVKALDIYRRIAQLDFGYRDVRQRVDELRNKKTKPTSQ